MFPGHEVTKSLCVFFIFWGSISSLHFILGRFTTSRCLRSDLATGWVGCTAILKGRAAQPDCQASSIEQRAVDAARHFLPVIFYDNTLIIDWK